MAAAHRRPTILVFGDQLNRRLGALSGVEPGQATVLLVESDELLAAGRHVQRNHLVVTAMRRFARELAAEGFDVDLRRAARCGPASRPTEPSGGRTGWWPPSPTPAGPGPCAVDLGIDMVRSDQFLCHHDDFARWATGRRSLRMEDFYRWTRSRLGYLMDGDQPVGGRWNFDAENREPPPADLSVFTPPLVDPLDELDAEVLAALPATHGAAPTGCGPPAGPGPWPASTTSSTTAWSGSAATRTPWPQGRGTSPIRCSARTSTWGCCCRARCATRSRPATGPAGCRWPRPRASSAR